MSDDRILRSHDLARTYLGFRVPRPINTFVVRNKRGRPITVATTMEFIPGKTLNETMTDLTPTMLNDLSILFRLLWSQRLSHGDPIGANIIFNRHTRRWVFIDLDNVKQHRSSHALAKNATWRHCGSNDEWLARYSLTPMCP